MPKIKINVNGIEQEVDIDEDDDEVCSKSIKVKNKKWFSYRTKIVSATPIICVALYLTIGFVWNIWHPTWLIFLLIPVMPVVLFGFGKGKNALMTIITVLVFIAFFILGFLGHWHPGWLVFFIIPIAGTLLPTKKKS